jgi:rRNA maturation RNase YbeY
MNRILIEKRQKKIKISISQIKKVANQILKDLGFNDHELSILLVDNNEISYLNQKYLKRSGPTDVISFSMQEGDFTEVNSKLLGDVVISLDEAKSQSEKKLESFEKEVFFLLLHGILHILGYDHENKKETIKMKKMEKKLMDYLFRLKLI